MNSDSFLKFLHVCSAGFFSGTLLAMLMVQSLMQRALDDGERKSLARAASTIGRLIVNPLGYAAFFTGILYWVTRYSFNGAGKLLACTPIHVHVMLTFGFLAVGMMQSWKGRARKLSAALETGASSNEIRAHLAKGWTFALLAILFILGAYFAAILKLPNVPPTHCN